MMIAKVDLLGTAAFITAIVGLIGFLLTQIARIKTEHAAKVALALQGVNSNSAVSGLVVLTERQDVAITKLQTIVDSLREGVVECEKSKEALAERVAKMAEELSRWYPDLANRSPSPRPPSS